MTTDSALAADSAFRPRPGTSTVTIAVRAADPIVAAGAAAYLSTRRGITPLPAEAAHHADVVLVLDDLIGEETLAWMQAVAGRAIRGEGRFVLISDEVRGPELQRAARCGLVSVLPRQGCDYERIVRTVLDLYQGRVGLPGAEFRSLLARPRTEPIHTTLLAPVPGEGGHLEDRERDVLRMLADGFGTAEIAGRLNYSERTVKNIIHRLLTRMNLRNRPHAVAFALRNGLL
ncbi:MAG TPA: response regulator transcription factor [Streptosporangiaceae bacterium]